MLEKLSATDRVDTIADIVAHYLENWYCVVSYLYFSNIMQYRLLEKPRNAEDTQYREALESSDFLLPDGIALQLFVEYWRSKKLHNLNGTDFLPFFLQYLQDSWQKFELYLYGAKSELTEVITTYFESQNYNVVYAQHGYTDEFDWSQIRESSDTLKILLIARWSPRQEIRVQDNIDMIKHHKLLVMNQWGTFDFFTWEEQRAPQRMVRARVLETFWRIITNPKKNLHKFLAMFGIVRYRWYLLSTKLKN